MMNLSELRNRCQDLSSRLARRPQPPQVRRKNLEALTELVDDLLASIRPDNREAGEMAKWALLDPTIQQGIARKVGG